MGCRGVLDVGKDGIDRPCIFIVIKVTNGIDSPPLKSVLDRQECRVVRFYSDGILWDSVFYLYGDN